MTTPVAIGSEWTREDGRKVRVVSVIDGPNGLIVRWRYDGPRPYTLGAQMAVFLGMWHPVVP